MLFAQLTHAIGLNDVCDALRLHSGLLSALRGATPPSRNNLSHANKHRAARVGRTAFLDSARVAAKAFSQICHRTSR